MQSSNTKKCLVYLLACEGFLVKYYIPGVLLESHYFERLVLMKLQTLVYKYQVFATAINLISTNGS